MFCRVTVDPGTVEGMRAVKSLREREAIRTTQEKTNEVMALAEEIIRTSTDRDGELWYAGAPLTSDALRREMHCWLLRHGCTAHDTIVSCGRRPAQPHNAGSGILRANEPFSSTSFHRTRKMDILLI